MVVEVHQIQKSTSGIHLSVKSQISSHSEHRVDSAVSALPRQVSFAKKHKTSKPISGPGPNLGGSAGWKAEDAERPPISKKDIEDLHSAYNKKKNEYDTNIRGKILKAESILTR